MATDNENLRSILGIPTPKADPDNATLRAVIGVPALQSEESPGGPGGASLPPARSPQFSPSLSPTQLPFVLMGG